MSESDPPDTAAPPAPSTSRQVTVVDVIDEIDLANAVVVNEFEVDETAVAGSSSSGVNINISSIRVVNQPQGIDNTNTEISGNDILEEAMNASRIERSLSSASTILMGSQNSQQSMSSGTGHMDYEEITDDENTFTNDSEPTPTPPKKRGRGRPRRSGV